MSINSCLYKELIRIEDPLVVTCIAYIRYFYVFQLGTPTYIALTYLSNVAMTLSFVQQEG